MSIIKNEDGMSGFGAFVIVGITLAPLFIGLALVFYMFSGMRQFFNGLAIIFGCMFVWQMAYLWGVVSVPLGG